MPGWPRAAPTDHRLGGRFAAGRSRLLSRLRRGTHGPAADELAQRERALAEQRVALVQLVSHELRTPLTVIRGCVETLAHRLDGVDPELRGLVDATARAATRLEDLLQVVLAATDELTPDVNTAAPVDVGALIEHAASSLHARLRDRVAVDLRDDARLVTIEPYLWLTIRCLLDNADRFSPDEEPIVVRYEREGDLAVITLQDSGPGLPEGFDAVAFDPFTQGDTSTVREHQGLGMGLYTARRLARRLGGDVEVSSTSSTAGLTARVTVPIPVDRDVDRDVDRGAQPDEDP